MAEAGTTLAIAKTAKAGSTCTATVLGQDVTVQVARDLTVAAGDPILLSKVGSQWFVISRFSSAAVATADLPTNPALPNPKPDVRSGVLIVAPIETRTWRSTGWRFETADVFHGEYGGQGNSAGSVFYGTKPTSLAGATVTSATIRVKRLTGGTYAAQATEMHLLDQAERPVSIPSWASSTTGPSINAGETVDDFAIPASWAQEMVDGTAGGLGFFASSGSPYARFAGRGSWGPAFTLSIYWTRG